MNVNVEADEVADMNAHVNMNADVNADMNAHVNMNADADMPMSMCRCRCGVKKMINDRCSILEFEIRWHQIVEANVEHRHYLPQMSRHHDLKTIENEPRVVLFPLEIL